MDIREASSVFLRLFGAYPGTWAAAGGWAVDLYLNRPTREHEDFEVIVLREERELLYSEIGNYGPQKILGDPPQFLPWRGEAFEPELIQLRLDPQRVGAGREFDLLLTPSDGPHWICRRHEGLRRPLSEVVLSTPSGVPALAPEIVLLFKAKYCRG